MISIVTIINDDQIFKINLLKSLNTQDIKYELITVDNRKNKFPNLTSALNYGGRQASGKYILFVHQDVSFNDSSWLRQVELKLSRLENLGIAGVSGKTDQGQSVGLIYDRGRIWGCPIKDSIVVQTLDEILLIIPKDVFIKQQFDEQFMYHSYGADYCLSLKNLNLKTYVISASVQHNSVTIKSLAAGSLEKDDFRLLKKHKNIINIHKTTGLVSEKIFKPNPIINTLNKLPTMKLLKKNKFSNLNFLLDGSKTFLDVGIMPAEQIWIKSIKNKKYSIGISDELPYILISKRIGVHDDFVLCQMDCLPFREKYFDLALFVGILEYSTKSKAISIINSVHSVSKKNIILVPNSCFSKSQSLKLFKSYWDSKDFKKLNYSVLGLDFARFGIFEILLNIVFQRILFINFLKISFFSSKILGYK